MSSNLVQLKSARTGVEAAEQLRKIVGRLARTLRLTHADGSLPPSQREVLATIVRSGPLRLSELAEEEGINPTTLSRILGHLENSGLVARRPDKADARVVHVSATEGGRALHEEMRSERTDALFYALGQLSVDQRKLILEALPAFETLVESLRNRNQ